MHPLFTRLGIKHPVIQAPMAAITTPALAAAVTNAGGLGSLGCADLTLEKMRAQVAELRGRTTGAFNLNFFVHEEPNLLAYDGDVMRKRLAPYYKELGLGDVPAPRVANPAFNAAALEVVLALRPPIVSFHFGAPIDAVRALKAAGIAVVASATTVAEARVIESAGCDAVVAQGAEAGGHRGVFLGPLDTPIAGTMALIPQMLRAVKIPVIAAGGIADGHGVAAVLKLGAAAAQLGTSFMLCPEAATHPLQRQAISTARDDSTCMTRLFSGRPARVITNRFVRENGDLETLTAPFPAQRALTAPLRDASRERGSVEFVPLFAGQAAAMARAMPAAELTAALVAESSQGLI